MTFFDGIILLHLPKQITMADTKPIDQGKTIIKTNEIAKPKLSELAGELSSETADAMIEYVVRSREEWEERIEKQF